MTRWTNAFFCTAIAATLLVIGCDTTRPPPPPPGRDLGADAARDGALVDGEVPPVDGEVPPVASHEVLAQ